MATENRCQRLARRLPPSGDSGSGHKTSTGSQLRGPTYGVVGLLKNALRQIRRNHALEHGTVAVLLERGVTPPLGGYSTRGGFFILSRASTDTVTAAAFEALGRITEGQRQLAISRHCGTNMAAGAVVAGLLTVLLVGKRGGRLPRIPALAAAIVGVNLLSRPIGNELQRRYTTLADLAGVEIADVYPLWKGRYPAHRVNTRLGEP